MRYCRAHAVLAQALGRGDIGGGLGLGLGLGLGAGIGIPNADANPRPSPNPRPRPSRSRNLARGHGDLPYISPMSPVYLPYISPHLASRNCDLLRGGSVRA